MVQRSWILVGTAALAINLLLFLLIPFLSQISADRQPEAIKSAFTFNNLRQNQPPPPPEKELKPPPPPRDLPKPPPANPLAQKQASPPKTPALNTPMPQFEAAVSDLKFGTMAFTGVAAPQTEFDISQIDTMPQIISRREPVYPYRARQKNINGMVLVKFLVTKEGTVQQASVVQSNPPEVFDEAALQAVGSWRFKPGMLDKEPVSTWISMPIKFQIQ